jgi:DNA topoisomerase-1
LTHSVVIVESPSKAKTINKYLGADFKVVASYGHIRDLPSKNGSVNPNDNFAMIWEVDEQGKKRIKDIVTVAKGAKNLFLATDPDREGEAISWHIQQVLEEMKATKGMNVQRIVFNEITKRAVQESLKEPRQVDKGLVDAYLARRALDYLVGFTLSPILWRKLPGARSAGRVQSVALRLIVEREQEIEAFKTQEYWSVETQCMNSASVNFMARLNYLHGKKLEKFGLPDEEAAKAAAQIIEKSTFTVGEIEKKQVRRNPAAPFTTSTLQQEASRKLGFSPKKTMQLAQRLYEGVDIGGETIGLVTYMRTDSVNLSNDALTAAREFIERDFGKQYLPAAPRLYKSKVKNAQEAHEAIRPTDVVRTPKAMSSYLDDAQLKLYELIWKRTLASQMENALFDQVGVDIVSHDKQTILRATGSTLIFDGFLKLYQEGKDQENKDEKAGEDDDRILPPLSVGEAIAINTIVPEQHFTQPPPRYTEASLVKKLEELGIGRPSTYVSLIQTLQDRDYVRIEKRQFHPDQRGRLVTSFLSHYFPKYIQYDFTADLEEQLDDISDGKRGWIDVMNAFWAPFHDTVKQAEPLKISQVLDDVQKDLEASLFDMTKENPKACPTCTEGQLSLKLSKFGPFLGCNRYPDCKYTKSLNGSVQSEDGLQEANDIIVIGQDPNLGVDITVRKGPYGPYLQWEQKDVKKPKRVSIPPGFDPYAMPLEQALKLASLPASIGKFPDTQDDILVGIGRFGPYLKYDGSFTSIPKAYNFMEITLEEALAILEKKRNAPPKAGFKPKVSPAPKTKTAAKAKK